MSEDSELDAVVVVLRKNSPDQRPLGTTVILHAYFIEARSTTSYLTWWKYGVLRKSSSKFCIHEHMHARELALTHTNAHFGLRRRFVRRACAIGFTSRDGLALFFDAPSDWQH